MSDTQDQSAAQRLPPSKHPRRYLLADVGIIAATCASASFAVPIMYAERCDEIIWGLSILAFVGFPVLAGIVRGKPSFPANLTAGMLLLACPIVYALTDPLPVPFELLRDAFFLATGSTLTFTNRRMDGELYAGPPMESNVCFHRDQRHRSGLDSRYGFHFHVPGMTIASNNSQPPNSACRPNRGQPVKRWEGFTVRNNQSVNASGYLSGGSTVKMLERYPAIQPGSCWSAAALPRSLSQNRRGVLDGTRRMPRPTSRTATRPASSMCVARHWNDMVRVHCIPALYRVFGLAEAPTVRRLALAILLLIAAAIGISHGTHAKLKLKDPESGEFVSRPSVLDVLLLALSSMMVLVAGCVAIAAY